MKFDLSWEPHREEFQRAVQRLFAERCPRSAVREAEANGTGHLPSLWQELADLGWLGLAIPTTYGGSGGSFLDLYLLYEEMGRFLVPGPHLDTIGLVADLILEAGSDEQKQLILPAISEGRYTVSVATCEQGGAFEPGDILTVAVGEGDLFRVTGQKLLVGYAELADAYVVTVRTDGGGITTLLVDSQSDGIEIEPMPNIAGTPLYGVTLDGVAVSRSQVIGNVGEGWKAFSRSASKAAVLQTSLIVGAAREVLEMTNQYAKDREQFGAAIGSYQAVQYMVSDILIALHTVDVLGKQAAYRIDTGRSFEREAAMAAAHGKRAAAHLHRQAHEVHAGIAFMHEYDLQLYSRRSKFWENNLGDARYHDEIVLSSMGV